MDYVRVPLPKEDIELIERLFYEYNAAKDIIAFLMQQDKVNEEYLQQYINIAEKRYAELEMQKAAVDKFYRPEGINPQSYQFDFEAEELVYTL
jgi:hypothetical protein